MKRPFLLLLYITLVNISLNAQPHFGNERGSLSYRNQEMLINPAYVGSKGLFNHLSLNAKGQWLGVDDAPQSQNLQYQIGLPTMGMGGWLYHESYGVTDNIQLNAVYAYRIKFERSQLSLGIQAGVLTTNDAMVTRINDENDPIFAEKSPRLWGFNAGFGAYYYSDEYYVGFSIPQLLTNDWDGGGAELSLDNSFVFDRLQYYITGGYVFDVTPKINIITTGLVQLSSALSFGYEGMVYGVYDRMYRVGVGFAAENAIRVEGEAYIGKQVSLAYRYEQNLGSTYKYMSTTHSLVLSVGWGKTYNQTPISLF